MRASESKGVDATGGSEAVKGYAPLSSSARLEVEEVEELLIVRTWCGDTSGCVIADAGKR
jgi:hypothetical protein